MDLAEEVMSLKIEQSKHAERLDDLEEYQRRQNGSLQRVEGKVEKMYQMIIGLLGGWWPGGGTGCHRLNGKVTNSPLNRHIKKSGKDI